MRRVLAVVLGIGLALNGLLMLAAPAPWYAAVPGVMQTGPFNPHFVRDIGAAYLVAGAALAWFAANPQKQPAAQAAAAFLTLHALVHLGDAAAGREHAEELLIDLVTVFLPSVLALWIAGRRIKVTREKHDDQMVLATKDRGVRAGMEL